MNSISDDLITRLKESEQRREAGYQSLNPLQSRSVEERAQKVIQAQYKKMALQRMMRQRLAQDPMMKDVLKYTRPTLEEIDE